MSAPPLGEYTHEMAWSRPPESEKTAVYDAAGSQEVELATSAEATSEADKLAYSSPRRQRAESEAQETDPPAGIEWLRPARSWHVLKISMSLLL